MEEKYRCESHGSRHIAMLTSLSGLLESTSCMHALFMFRGRADKEVMPAFRKFDPKRFNPNTGRLMQSSMTKNLAQKAMPAVVPFSKVIVAAFMAHQVFTIVRRWIRGQREEPVMEEPRDASEPVDGSSAPPLAPSSRAAQSAMTQAMIRNALPRPKSVSMSKRLSDAHQQRHSSAVSSKMDRSLGDSNNTKKGQLKTSKQMMGGPKVGAEAPGGLRMREVGVLGKIEAEAKAANKAQQSTIKK